MISVTRVSKTNIDLVNLVRLLDLDLDSRYGIIQEQYNKFNLLDNVEAAVIAYSESIPVGCGCFKKYDKKTIEVKRMFVKQEYRGRGIAKLILRKLEELAIEDNYSRAILETGKQQPESIKLYENSGYCIIENYGQYVGNFNSICMSKPLK